MYKGCVIGIVVMGSAFNCGVIWVYSILVRRTAEALDSEFRGYLSYLRLEDRDSAYRSARTFAFTDSPEEWAIGYIGWLERSEYL